MIRLSNYVKTVLRIAIVLVFACSLPGEIRAQASQGVMTKLKNWFTTTPTPTPRPKKKTTSTTSRKRSPTPAPRSSATPRPKPGKSPRPRPEAPGTPLPSPSETPEPSVSPGAGAEESPTETPEPSESPAPSITEATAPPQKPQATVRTEVVASSPAKPRSPAKSPAATASPGRTAPVSIASSEIIGFGKNPPSVRRILDLALSLTTQNLGYKYGSSDPAQGGMDCSGFIYYVLKQSGMKEVPRDAREQYIWVRKAGKFQAVLGRSPDTFELDDLKPGDLMFWAGTYSIDRDPAITHTMIYLGREKSSNQRIMVGASDGRTYKGQSRYGVSIFDFKMAGRRATSNGEPGPTFVGYASIPGLGEG